MLHGKNDTIIDSKHSKVLYEKCASWTKLVLFDNMAHNSFDLKTCLVEPTLTYLKSLYLKDNKVQLENRKLHFLSKIFCKKIEFEI